MATSLLERHDLLSHLRRFTFGELPGERPANMEYLCLLGCGITAGAAVTLLDFSLKIPGHAILRAIVPLVCGLAMVPRRGAGSFMSLTAATTALTLRGWHLGELPLGSFTSLLLCGPLLDLVLRNAQPGWWLYLRVASVGVLVSWIALAARLSEYLLGQHLLGGRTPAQFLSKAGFTYTLCGALAGLLSAALVFRADGPRREEQSNEPQSLDRAEGFAHDPGRS